MFPDASGDIQHSDRRSGLQAGVRIIAYLNFRHDIDAASASQRLTQQVTNGSLATAFSAVGLCSSACQVLR